MKLINSSVQLIEQGPGIEGIYKQIELAGRVCYKSESKITENSAKEFVDRMIKSGHGAMLEHGTVYMQYSCDNWQENFSELPQVITLFVKGNKFSKIREITDVIENDIEKTTFYITTNARVLVEHDFWDAAQEFICEPTEHHVKRVTCKFICDRGISHEIVRHRVFSYAMESQRYCNYSKDKFDNEITFIKPEWFAGSQINDTKLWSANNNIDVAFLTAVEKAEQDYLLLLSEGCKPQQARAVLPNATKTELVMTGFEDDFDHFFELRCAPSAHPDMQKLANELKQLMGK